MDAATGKPVATTEEPGTVDLSESETWSSHEEEVTGKFVAYKTATWKPGASSKSKNSGNPKAERKEWSHNLHMSPATVPHTGAVSLLDRQENLRTRARGPNGGPGRERGCLGGYS